MRARVVALVRIAQAIKRGKAAYETDGVFVEFANPVAIADVFESCVIPHAVASESEWWITSCAALLPLVQGIFI